MEVTRTASGAPVSFRQLERMLAFHPVLKFKTGILAQPRSPASVQSPSCMSGFYQVAHNARLEHLTNFYGRSRALRLSRHLERKTRRWRMVGCGLYHLRACPGNVVSVLVGVMSFSKINSEGFKSPVTGTRVLEILCVKNRPERPLRSLIAKAHSQKPNCSTPTKVKKS